MNTEQTSKNIFMYNENYLFKTLGLKLYNIIYGSTTNAISKLIFLANTPTRDLIIYYFE